jgi:hypothetical protein
MVTWVSDWLQKLEKVPVLIGVKVSRLGDREMRFKIVGDESETVLR